PRIARLTFGGVTVERRLVGSREIVADCRAARLCLHQHEAPRLGQSDRRRVRGERQQLRNERGIDRVAAEAAHVPPPAHQLGKLRLEGGIEAWRRLSCFCRHTGKLMEYRWISRYAGLFGSIP